MLISLRQFGKYVALSIFLWATGIIVGGECLHHAVHDCKAHGHAHEHGQNEEGSKECSWQCLLLEPLVTARHQFSIDPPEIAPLALCKTTEYSSIDATKTYLSRAPPAVI